LVVLKFKRWLKGNTFLKLKTSRIIFFIEVISVGYRTIETDCIDIYNKNEVKIDFYLAEDDRPFIYCPPDVEFKN
jgi:hypothetical protein